MISGAVYRGLPRNALILEPAGDTTEENPKSMSLMLPVESIMMLDGLMSPCTTRLECRKTTALRILRNITSLREVFESAALGYREVVLEQAQVSLQGVFAGLLHQQIEGGLVQVHFGESGQVLASCVLQNVDLELAIRLGLAWLDGMLP